VAVDVRERVGEIRVLEPVPAGSGDIDENGSLDVEALVLGL